MQALAGFLYDDPLSGFFLLTVAGVTLLAALGSISYIGAQEDSGEPYLIETTHGPIVCVPYSNDVNDFNMFARGSLSTRDGFDMLKLCFDQLYAEGATTGRIMNVGVHPHVIGQPHRIQALREFIEYVKGMADVWHPSREQIATWYLAHHSSHIAQPPDRHAIVRHSVRQMLRSLRRSAKCRFFWMQGRAPRRSDRSAFAEPAQP